MYDVHIAALVKALASVLLSKSLTDDDKRHVSELLDEEITAITAAGNENVDEIAQLAVKNATKKRRQSQGVASRTSQKREALRRSFSSSTY